MPKKIKIGITGPESTGKSTLSKALCSHYDALYIEDYSRTFFKNKPISNAYADIIEIAQKQITLEREAIESSGKTLVICDSDLINIKIWLDYYNYKTPSFIEDHLEKYPNDFSLLLFPNTPWQKDALRKNEFDRLELFNKFESELGKYSYPHIIIKKLDAERLHQAILEIDQFLKS